MVDMYQFGACVEFILYGSRFSIADNRQTPHYSHSPTGIWSTACRKTGSTFVYIPRWSGLAKNVPVLPKRSQRPLNPALNFNFFINNCYYRAYGMAIFLKSADNGLYGCIRVVGANWRKWGRFRGVFVGDPVRLMGSWDQLEKFQ